MKKYILYTVLLFGFLGFSQESKPSSPITIGETISFNSDILHENRTFNLYLPKGYTKNDTKTYPVIYLLDGALTDGFTYVSGLAQFSATQLKTMPEAIIVGIVNVDRKRDYTYPSRNFIDTKQFPTSGKSDTFIRFLANELLPFIGKHYKTNGQRTVVGETFGGLLATEILLTSPELFQKYILISPSLWWDNAFLVTANTANIPAHTAIYLAIWNRDPLSLKPVAKLMRQLQLTNKLHPEKQLDLTYDVIKSNTNGNVIYTALYEGFKYSN